MRERIAVRLTWTNPPTIASRNVQYHEDLGNDFMLDMVRRAAETCICAQTEFSRSTWRGVA